MKAKVFNFFKLDINQLDNQSINRTYHETNTIQQKPKKEIFIMDEQGRILDEKGNIMQIKVKIIFYLASNTINFENKYK